MVLPSLILFTINRGFWVAIGFSGALALEKKNYLMILNGWDYSCTLALTLDGTSNAYKFAWWVL